MMIESSDTFASRVQQSAHVLRSVLFVGGLIRVMLPDGCLCRVVSVDVSNDQLRLALVDVVDRRQTVFYIDIPLGYPQFLFQFPKDRYSEILETQYYFESQEWFVNTIQSSLDVGAVVYRATGDNPRRVHAIWFAERKVVMKLGTPTYQLHTFLAGEHFTVQFSECLC